LLTVSETSNGYFCFEWLITEGGPKIVNFKHLNLKASLNNSNTFKKIIDLLNPHLKTNPKSISISLNRSNYYVSEFEYDSKIGLKESISWYEKTILEPDFFDSHNFYYYPLYENNSLLVLSISKNIRKQLIETATGLGYKLIYLSADIFSVSTGVKQIYKTDKLTSHVIWKIAKNNHHYLLYYKTGILCSYLKIKINKKNIKVCVNIGEEKSINALVEFLFSTLINKKYDDKFHNIYAYQTKSNKNTLNEVLSINKNIKVIDLSRVSMNKHNPLKISGYAENGISFKGLDV